MTDLAVRCSTGSVELSCVAIDTLTEGVAIDTLTEGVYSDTIQLHSTLSSVELSWRSVSSDATQLDVELS